MLGLDEARSLFSTTVSQCLDNIASWMRSNRLQLNTDKTEVMWCASTCKLSQLPSLPLSIAGTLVCPVNAVRDLGVFIDSDLGAATHVLRTMSRCFAALRQLRHLCRYVTDGCFRSLVLSLVHSRLDCGNFVLVGFPVYLQRRLQSVSTLRLVWYFDYVYVVTTMSQTPLQLCTGYVCHNVLTSRWLSRRFGCYTVLRRHT